MSDLAKHLSTSPSSLQRELRTLSEAGILEKRTDGKRVYYRPDEQCPIQKDLQGILKKTSGVEQVIKNILSNFSNLIQFAFVYGSVAQGQELSSSDIDLVIVGDVGLKKLIPKLREAERELMRPVNPVTYSLKEFKDKIKSRDHFVVSLVKDKKLFIQGENEYLEAIAG